MITRPERASPAEIFITRLGQDYVSGFVGFNIREAGTFIRLLRFSNWLLTFCQGWNNSLAAGLTTQTLTNARKFVEDFLPNSENVDRVMRSIERFRAAREGLIRKLVARKVEAVYREHYRLAKELFPSLMRLQLV